MDLQTITFCMSQQVLNIYKDVYNCSTRKQKNETFEVKMYDKN